MKEQRMQWSDRLLLLALTVAAALLIREVVAIAPVWLDDYRMQKTAEWQQSLEQGCLTSEAVGVSVQLYRGNDQAVIDAEDSAVVLPEYFGSYAIGTPGRASIVGDHNYQTGALLAGLAIGDEIVVQTDWGTFRYTVVRSGTATRVLIKDGKASAFYMNDDGLSVFDHCRQHQFDGLVFYTCYPFEPGITDQRFVIFAQRERW